MIKLIFPEPLLVDLRRSMQSGALSTLALISARPARTPRGDLRLLVQSMSIPESHQYEERTESSARLSKPFWQASKETALQHNLVLIYVHSHVARIRSAFCGNELCGFDTSRHLPELPELALAMGTEELEAYPLGSEMPVETWEVGRHIRRHYPRDISQVSLRYDRQLRAFGKEGQRSIRSLRVAIVGLGGTGSLVAQQLAHLGVRSYLLIDPDLLDETSLNRVVGAARSDLGSPKVSTAARMIRRINRRAIIDAVQGDVLEREVGRMLIDVDFIFSCTDSHGSRHLINQLVYQYFIPCIDMGVIITPDGGRVSHFGGRVQMLAPGIGCLVCRGGILSPDQVRRDLSTVNQQMADPYFDQSTGITQPSVISLNSQAAGQAVTMFLAAAAGVPMIARSQTIRGIQGVVRALEDTPRENCVNCSSLGFYGRGSQYDLPVRLEECAS